MTNILMAMVAKIYFFFTKCKNHGPDILVTIYELHYTILPNCSARIWGEHVNSTFM